MNVFVWRHKLCTFSFPWMMLYDHIIVLSTLPCPAMSCSVRDCDSNIESIRSTCVCAFCAIAVAFLGFKTFRSIACGSANNVSFQYHCPFFR